MTARASGCLADVLLKRKEYLEMFDRFPATKATLVEELDVPRSTLDDVIRELEAHDLVKYEDGQWVVTNVGSCAQDIHAAYCERLDSLKEATEILNRLPADCPLDATVITGAKAYETHPKVLDSSLEVAFRYLDSASTVRVVTPKAVGASAIAFYERVTSNEEYSLEVIAPMAILDHFKERHEEFADEVRTDDDTVVYESAVPFDVCLWVVPDDHVGIVVFTDWGVRGGLINDSDDAIEWGIAQYEEIKRDAVRACD